MTLKNRDEVQYCEISKEMSLLYYGLDVFSTSLKLKSQNLTQCTEYSVLCTVHSCWGGRGLRVKSKDSSLGCARLASFFVSLFRISKRNAIRFA